MARVRIIAGTDRSDRATIIDGELYDALETSRLLLPTRRYARERSVALINRFDLPGLLGAPILSFEDFVSQIVHNTEFERRRIGPVAQRIYFEHALQFVQDKAAAEFRRGSTTEGFITHAQRVIGQLKQAAIDPAEFHNRVASQPQSRPIDRLIAAIYSAYQDLLQADHAYDLQGLYWMADLCCRNTKPPALEHVSTLFTDGFDDFTPAEFRVLIAVAPHVDQLVLGLRLDPSPDRADLYALPLRTEERLRTAFNAILEQPPPRPPSTQAEFVTEHLFWRDTPPSASGLTENVELYACHDLRHELETIGRDIKRRILLGEAAAHDFAIVARNLDSILPDIRSIFGEFGLPFDAPANERFSEIREGQFVAGLFDAINGWEHHAVLGFLSHRFSQIIFGVDIDALRQLPALVRAEGILNGRDAWFLAAKRAVSTASSFGSAFLELVHRVIEIDDRLPIAASIEEHLDALLAVTHQFEPNSPHDINETWSYFRDVLGEWRSAVGAADTILPRSEFFARARSLLNRASWPSAGTNGGVVCLDLTAARHLRFAHVYCVCLNEGEFPARVSRSAVYRPFDLLRLRSHGIDLEAPGVQRERERLLFSHVFEIGRQSVTLSWHTLEANGQSAAPSPFIGDVVELLPYATVHAPKSPAEVLVPPLEHAAGERDVLFCAQTGAIEIIDDALPSLAAVRAGSAIERSRYASSPFDEFDGVIAGASLLALLAERYGADHVFSATELESFIECPFHFFAQRVLGIDELERDPFELDPRERGQLMHGVLEKFHHYFAKTAWPGISESDAMSVMERLTAEAFARRIPRYAPAVWDVERARMERLLRRYVIIERSRDEVAWLPDKLEFSFGRNKPDDEGRAACVLDTPAGPIRFSGIIDRIDVHGDLLRIVDYKSTVSVAPKDLDSGAALQLMLYTCAVENFFPDRECAAALYLAPGVMKTRDALERGKRDVFNQRRERVQERVAAAVLAMRAGRFDVTHGTASCRYCPAGKVCRYERARIERKVTAAQGDAS